MKKLKIATFIPKPVTRRKDMNWFQASQKYPKLPPFGDTDRDGVLNMFDCKPFDNKRKDELDNMEKEAKENERIVSERYGAEKGARYAKQYKDRQMLIHDENRSV